MRQEVVRMSELFRVSSGVLIGQQPSTAVCSAQRRRNGRSCKMTFSVGVPWRREEGCPTEIMSRSCTI